LFETGFTATAIGGPQLVGIVAETVVPLMTETVLSL